MKRFIDLALSALLLIVLLPLLLLIAVCVRATSRGPAIFRQERVGRNGRCFMIWKFRSMRVENQGRLITVGGDNRVTRFGSFLRRTKLDELPQLVNVLVGDMSFVGPRPEVAKYMNLYPASVREEVLSVRPGIIDWASIHFRDEARVLALVDDPDLYYVENVLPEKQAMYLEYVRNWSLMGDLKVIGCYLLLILGFAERGSRRAR